MEEKTCRFCKWSASPSRKQATEEVRKAFDVLEKECVIVPKDSRKVARAIVAMAENAAFSACDVCVCLLGAFDDGKISYGDVLIVRPEGCCEFWEEVYV